MLRILTIVSVILFQSFFSYSQIEISHLKREKEKGRFGWGGSLHLGVPISAKSSVTGDIGFILADKDENDKSYVIVPGSLGYRYYLKAEGSTFFFEPQAGYCWGGTDYIRQDENGQDIYEITNGEGKPVYEESKGFLAGMNVGYHFAGKFPFDIAIRYQRVFVSVDPSINAFSLRFSGAIRKKKK